MTGSSGLHQIELRGIPVPLWQQARIWFESLLREFAIINTQEPGSVPQELLSFVAEVRGRFAQFGRSDRLLDQAIADGVMEVDQQLELPAMAREASLELWELIDRAREFCAADRLLTLVPEPEVGRFVHWYLHEIVGQIAGEPPTRWTRSPSEGGG